MDEVCFPSLEFVWAVWRNKGSFSVSLLDRNSGDMRLRSGEGSGRAV